jgi:hypothetical protein
MIKIFVPIIAILLLTSCGETKKTDQLETDSIPSDTALVDENLQKGGDTLEDLENITEREVAKYWDNKAGDITQADADYIDKLVRTSTEKTIGDNSDVEYTSDYLNETALKKLTTSRFIYYILTYPASFSQNCSMDEYQDSTNTPKILNYFADSFDEADLSALQQKILELKGDSVILVLNQFINKHPAHTEPMYLTLLRDLNAIKSIPVLVKTASSKNLGNFTLLINFMNRASYEPFKSTEIYQNMFGENSYTYGQRVEANEENMKTIKDLATEFYKEKKKK